jgi:hypothetical protein
LVIRHLFLIFNYKLKDRDMRKDDLKINQIVELKEEFKTPRCNKGGNFAHYRVVKIHRMNCVAINLGTLVECQLRIAKLK